MLMSHSTAKVIWRQDLCSVLELLDLRKLVVKLILLSGLEFIIFGQEFYRCLGGLCYLPLGLVS